MEIENVKILKKEEYERICKDRLDFGFDSIYFRYAAAIDELRALKEKTEHRDYKAWADGCKMHFYNALEQLIQIHKEKK